MKELSAALGDDADFAGSMTTLVSDTKIELEGDIAALSGSLVAADAAEAAAREAGDAQIEATLKGVASNLEANIKSEYVARAEGDAQIEATLKGVASNLETIDNEIIAAVGYNDRGDASGVLYNEYAAQTEVAFEADGNTEFYPVNEANFQAWLDKKAEEAREGLNEELRGMIQEVAEETSEADTEIIAAVGYNDRGAASAAAYNEYAAETEAAIEAGGSEFAPINEANFQLWLDAKTSSQLKDSISEEAKMRQEADDAIKGDLKAVASDLDAKIAEEIKAEAGTREAADIALGLRIDDVISNTDPAALDSLSEIVAAFQSADSDLNKAITDVLGTHTSELAALSGSLVADIAAADVAVIEAFKEGDKALAEQLASEVITLDVAISAEAKTREDADAAINESIAKLNAGTNEQFASLDQKIEEEINRAGEAEAALDGKISDIISNTDLTALDSFSEVEAGVNAGFAELKTMILDVVQNSIERNFGAIAADGTQVLFAGYTTEYPKVFVNGILQEEGVDYTKASGIDGKGNPFSDITFTIAPVAGARVVVTGTESAGYASDRYEAPVIFTPEPEK